MWKEGWKKLLVMVHEWNAITSVEGERKKNLIPLVERNKYMHSSEQRLGRIKITKPQTQDSNYRLSHKEASLEQQRMSHNFSLF